MLTFSNFIILSVYFKDKLALAIGICFTGGGIGQIILPYLFNYLLYVLDVRGACFVMGAGMLHTLIGSSLYRPASYYTNFKNKNVTTGTQMTTHLKIRKEYSQQISDLGPIGSFTYTETRVCQVNMVYAPREEPVNYIVPEVVQDSANVSNSSNISKSPAISDWHIQRMQPTGTVSVNRNVNDAELQLSAMCLSRNHDGGVTTDPDGDATTSSPISVASGNLNNRIIEQGTKEDIPAIQRLTFKEDIRKMCSMSTFSLFVIARVITYLAYMLPVYFLAPYASGEGLSTDQVNMILTVFGAVDIATRSLHGMIVTFLHIDSCVYVGCLALVAGTINGMYSSGWTKTNIY